jgi:hypothetical protein
VELSFVSPIVGFQAQAQLVIDDEKIAFEIRRSKLAPAAPTERTRVLKLIALPSGAHVAVRKLLPGAPQLNRLNLLFVCTTC